MFERFPSIARYFGLDEKDSTLLAKRPVEKVPSRKELTKLHEKAIKENKSREHYNTLLKTIQEYDGGSFLSGRFSPYEKRLIRNLRKKEVLTNSVIDAEIEKGIVSRAMDAYNHAMSGSPLDHVLNAEELAYTLVRHPTMFAEDQLRVLRSRLDHGMTMQNFRD